VHSLPPVLHERAYAKLNLVLQVGPPREDGMHPICSVMASIDLADELTAVPRESGGDIVESPGIEGDNLAAQALAEFRSHADVDLPPLELRIDKRIPVAAGLGGGSADAAAALRIANELTGRPLGHEELVRLAAGLGADVPSQVDPRHAFVHGVGERVEAMVLPPLAAVLIPDADGLSTAAVYAELDRLGVWRAEFDSTRLRRLDGVGPAEVVAALENDLQQAALSLRPDLAQRLEALRRAGALGAAVSGSGPTCFGLFTDRAVAEDATASIPGALVTELR
jgi:4-diphosphocytidyl-2-C-methyl-D-erythritol kinase